jgi:hypothetical protein
MVLPVLLETYMPAILLALLLTACAAKTPPEPHLTLEQLRGYTVTNADCGRQDHLIYLLEHSCMKSGNFFPRCIWGAQHTI